MPQLSQHCISLSFCITDGLQAVCILKKANIVFALVEFNMKCWPAQRVAFALEVRWSDIEVNAIIHGGWLIWVSQSPSDTLITT